MDFREKKVSNLLSIFIFQYINLQNLTVGNLAYEMVDGKYTPMSVCQEFYRNSSIDPGNETYDIDPHVDKGRSTVHEQKIF